jgi:hypothetical protein
VNNDMKLSATKPSTGLILSRISLKRTQYAALMMFGIGIMLAVIAASVSKDEAPVVGGWAVAFLVLAATLIIAAIGGQLVGVGASNSTTSWQTAAVMFQTLPTLATFLGLPTPPTVPMITT